MGRVCCWLRAGGGVVYRGIIAIYWKLVVQATEIALFSI